MCIKWFSASGGSAVRTRSDFWRALRESLRRAEHCLDACRRNASLDAAMRWRVTSLPSRSRSWPSGLCYALTLPPWQYCPNGGCRSRGASAGGSTILATIAAEIRCAYRGGFIRAFQNMVGCRPLLGVGRVLPTSKTRPPFALSHITQGRHGRLPSVQSRVRRRGRQ